MESKLLFEKIICENGTIRTVAEILRGELTYSATEVEKGQLKLDDLNFTPRNIASLLDRVEALLTHLGRKNNKSWSGFLKLLNNGQRKGAHKEFSDLLLAWTFEAFPQYRPVDITPEGSCYLIDTEGALRSANIASFETEKVIQKLNETKWDKIQQFSSMLHRETDFEKVKALTIEAIRDLLTNIQYRPQS